MKTPADPAPLAGLGVLVTRPAHQAGPLCGLIEAQGGNAIRFPVLEIVDSTRPDELQGIIEQLDDYDCAIFISANAVNRALVPILEQRDWPAALRIAVIGRRSAQELEQFGLQADIFPSHHFTSEALLDLPELQDISGQRFVIFRGEGGREFLAQALRERGAQVRYVETYRRVRPRCDSAGLLSRWRNGDIDIVLVNSAESLDNLLAMLGDAGRSLLLGTRLLVVSDRMLPIAGKLGFRHPPVVAENATDEAVMRALLAWKRVH